MTPIRSPGPVPHPTGIDAEPLNKHAFKGARTGTISDIALVLTQDRFETLLEMNERLVPTLFHKIVD